MILEEALQWEGCEVGYVIHICPGVLILDDDFLFHIDVYEPSLKTKCSIYSCGNRRLCTKVKDSKQIRKAVKKRTFSILMIFLKWNTLEM